MTTTGKGPAGPGGGSSAPVDETIDGLPDIYALRDRLADTVSTQDALIEALNGQLPGQ